MGTGASAKKEAVVTASAVPANPAASAAPAAGKGGPASDLRLEELDGKMVEDFDASIGPLQNVSAWLGLAPPANHPTYKALHSNFPGSLPGQAVLKRCIAATRQYGLTPENTIYGQSICPDEINNEEGDLASIMQQHWGECFPMGGIGGAPYVGQTGFMAFSNHVPEDGHVMVLFGPHVAISATGEIGKYKRIGQAKESTACGAVLAAYNACCAGPVEGDDPLDMQQNWLKQKVSDQLDKIKAADNPLQTLFYTAYEAVKEKLLVCVNHKYGSGNLVLIGGIQINMPEPFEDHFCPLMFQVSSASTPPADLMSAFSYEAPASAADKSAHSLAVAAAAKQTNQVFSWQELIPPPVSPCFNALHSGFPGTIPGQVVLHRSVQALRKLGICPDNTIFGQSICPDEINNEKGDLAFIMKQHWGSCFPMGGIGGAPYVGKTGFMAFSNHVPDDGHVMILFGPHVAVSEDGQVGKYKRIGQSGLSGACGAVLAAYSSALANKKFDDMETDMQETWLFREVEKHLDTIKAAEFPIAALTQVAFTACKEKILGIVNHNYGPGYLVLLGGIQINMPAPYEDAFQPLFFQVSNKDQSLNLLDSLALQ